MLHLRQRIFSHILSSSSTSTSAISPLHRLISAAVVPIFPSQGFAVGEYLVDNFLRALQRSSYLLSSDLDKVINPNVVFLRECGLGDCDIAKLCIRVPRMLTANPDRVRAMAAHAERLGVPRGSGMFMIALQAVAFLSEEKITAKVDYLKNTFSWSDAEVALALSKAPMLLRRSKDILQCRFEFLVSEVGLEPAYIAHRPVMLYYSLEERLKPRCYVLKFIKQNGLVNHDPSFSGALTRTEKDFMEMYICPHKEAAPHLAQDYATACKGEVPTNFRFT
uniref:Uncharacterized protein n=1 Tax=Hordeum vulgare subsp. vulgare TaxID=112509 RepID=A0A8I6XXP0_HORVV